MSISPETLANRRRQREWRERNKHTAKFRAKKNKDNRRHYTKHKVRLLEKVKVARKENPDKFRDQNLRQRFGITLVQYLALLKKQKGRCRICRRKPNGKYLAVDHCHRTGRIRGLLCHFCNQGLGMFKDSPKLLKKAIAYLKGT